jgi:Na+/proline symporter
MNVLTPGTNGSGPATATARRTPTATRRGLTPIAGRRDLRTTPPGSSTRISLRALLEAGGAAAAVLYVILSIYYDRFYSRLGIEPGDVGLDRTAIIERAVGGVIALAATLIVVGVAYSQLLLVYSFFMQRLGQHILRRTRPNAEADIELIRQRSPLFGTLVAATLIERPSLSVGRKRSVLLAGLFAVPFLGLALFTTWSNVNNAASAAASGQVVRPFTFLGLRVLDIESRPCTANWIGTPATHPAALRSPDLRCLGTANGTTIFRAGPTTITVPAGQVVISLQS